MHVIKQPADNLGDKNEEQADQEEDIDLTKLGLDNTIV
jgi:hypothetical protein